MWAACVFVRVCTRNSICGHVCMCACMSPATSQQVDVAQAQACPESQDMPPFHGTPPPTPPSHSVFRVGGPTLRARLHGHESLTKREPGNRTYLHRAPTYPFCPPQPPALCFLSMQMSGGAGRWAFAPDPRHKPGKYQFTIQECSPARRHKICILSAHPLLFM
jgi:hypothetical protein